jgi:hypothetical protein
VRPTCPLTDARRLCCAAIFRSARDADRTGGFASLGSTASAASGPPAGGQGGSYGAGFPGITGANSVAAASYGTIDIH